VTLGYFLILSLLGFSPAGNVKMVQPPLKAVWLFLQESNTGLPYMLEISHLGICLEKMRSKRY
jgi:hypothetical protein